ncbi:hypothetical protein RRG08_049935 [Elysia crispata]|uniref:Uncharacterized protein n=1 Tax=Elysia crispata TaxID=231223 RepID=A0AAE0XZB0_9GAST|nr:hypothetical protein RRG08_049935 [Elysia crispata]
MLRVYYRLTIGDHPRELQLVTATNRTAGVYQRDSSANIAVNQNRAIRALYSTPPLGWHSARLGHQTVGRARSHSATIQHLLYSTRAYRMTVLAVPIQSFQDPYNVPAQKGQPPGIPSSALHSTCSQGCYTITVPNACLHQFSLGWMHWCST